MVALAIGYALVGVLANRFGRKKCTLIAVTGSTIFHIILAFSPNYWFYIFATFCNGLFASGQYFCIIWAQELIFPSKKKLVPTFTSKSKFVVNTCFSSMYALGGAATSLVAYLVQDWSRIYIVCGVGYFLSLLPLLFIPESLDFLIIQNKIKATTKILKNICRKNKLDIASDDVFKNLSDIPKEPPLDGKQTRAIERLICGNKKLRKRLIVNCLLSVFFSLGFYTLIYNSANLGGNVYIINAIGGILDIVSYAALYAIIGKVKRKPTLILLSSAIGIFCVLSPILKPVNTTAAIAFALIGRFFCNAAIVFIVSITEEFFATSMRAYSVVIVIMCSLLGSIISPQLVYAGEKCDWSIPFYVVGGLGFFSIFLILLLPETYNRSLPTTLQEALMLKDPKPLSIGKAENKAENLNNAEKANSLNSSVHEA